MTMLDRDHALRAIRHSPLRADAALEPACAIRALDACDAAAIARLLDGLDFAAHCARHGWIGSDAPLVGHVDGLVGARHTLGLFVGSELVGCIEIYRENPFCADAALVVDPRWRRQGFGRALLESAIAWAGSNALPTIRLTFARHNWPMRRLVAGADARLDIADDEICAEIAVAGA